MKSEASLHVEKIAADPAFQGLLKRKKAFIVRTTIFFLIYYFTLLVLVGWKPDLMKMEIIGKVNLAYLFALSQFFMAWIVSFIYVRKALAWDEAAKNVIK